MPIRSCSFHLHRELLPLLLEKPIKRYHLSRVNHTILFCECTELLARYSAGTNLVLNLVVDELRLASLSLLCFTVCEYAHVTMITFCHATCTLDPLQISSSSPHVIQWHICLSSIGLTANLVGWNDIER